MNNIARFVPRTVFNRSSKVVLKPRFLANTIRFSVKRITAALVVNSFFATSYVLRTTATPKSFGRHGVSS